MILPNEVQNFITLVISICVEAFPFVVIGVVISTLIEIFVKDSWIVKISPKNRFLAHLLPAVLGFFIPVCECGNVPVVRKMIQKGFSVSQSITFLLAAPIVNPVVWITTAEAFNFDKNIATIRIFWGLGIAVFLGLLFSFKKNPQEWLVNDFAESCEHNHLVGIHEHSYSHKHKSQHMLNRKQYIFEVFQNFQAEISQVMQMLAVGAILAATVQTFIPRQSIVAIGQNPILSVFCMLILAFVVSMCSNVDAFFALSLSSSFSIGGLMTFMVFGPMIDIKILTMLRTTFTARFLLQLVVLVAILSLIAGFGTNLIYHRS